jgi:basic amino acid/polyamine antiporter, APA family
VITKTTLKGNFVNDPKSLGLEPANPVTEPDLVEHPTGVSKPTISFFDAVALIVGIVIGAGIFETPALVASNVHTPNGLMLVWIAGGFISLIGALCYAELATTYPHVGGNYHYLQRAYGSNLAFLFAWARMTVVQTGSIALLAFVLGDYASQIYRLGAFSPSIYAALAILVLTVINLLGLRQSKRTQNWLSAAKIIGLVLVVGFGLAIAVPNPPVAAAATEPTDWGSAMVFVLLSYGGWNEAAYISAEIQNPKRNIVRSLLWSIGLITAIYLAINLAYMHGLGIAAMANSSAVAADLMRRALGPMGVVFISSLIVVSTLGALNATLFTGARTNYALGQDFERFRFLGRWQQQAHTPSSALILQGVVSLLLVGLGSFTRNGFKTMVDYTAPVFWFFFLLVGLALIILRYKNPQRLRPFQVPLYPVTPLLFCLICGYLLYSSLVYVNVGAIVGVVVVALGIPLLFWKQTRSSN